MAAAEMSCKDTKQHYRSVETESRQQHGGAQCNQIASVPSLLLLPLLSSSPCLFLHVPLFLVNMDDLLIDQSYF